MDTHQTNLSHEFSLARRSTYLKINLDTILNNIRILKQKCAAHTEIMAVLKANGYGHGSVPMAKFLEAHGFRHFAVATGQEGEEMRRAGVKSNIHVLGNGSIEEIPICWEHALIPTVGTAEYLSAWLDHWRSNDATTPSGRPVGPVMIKIDTGMSRNGCQPEELPRLVEFCTNNGIPIHSLMSHFAQAWDDPVFTKEQYDLFLETVQPYRSTGVKFHIANSAGVVNGIGTDLDYVRPGICMYGQPPDGTAYSINTMKELGLKPAISWMAKRVLAKRLPSDRKVGYDQTYICKEPEVIATLPVGYADGYLRNMSGIGSLTTVNGVVCPVVGRISMDAITVRLPEEARECREFFMIKDDFNQVNSAVGIANLTNTIPYEICTNLDRRLPRIYKADDKIQTFL